MIGDESTHAKDFTRDNYRRLLTLAKSTYRFVTYDHVEGAEGRVAVWRHDVDMSIHASLRMAEIEADEGVVSTYFLYPHCHYYNLFEPEIRERVRRIRSLGHHLGLHFDAGFHGVTDIAGLERALAVERRWLVELYGEPIDAFSFHDPNDFTLGCDAIRYAGMVNCYARLLRDAFGYCSDSNGYWRHRRLEDVLTAAADERLQVLTHPEWWQDDVMPPRQRVHRCIDGRAAYLKRRYDDGMKAVNRLNLSDE